MSTWIYLQCLNHDPILVADEESGQHLSDLAQIRADLATPLAVLREQALIATVPSAFEDDPWYFRRHSIRFRTQHPKCRIGIIDEYLRTYEEPE